MATATTSKAGADGQRFVLFDIGWEGYQTLLRMLGDCPVRVTYDRRKCRAHDDIAHPRDLQAFVRADG